MGQFFYGHVAPVAVAVVLAGVAASRSAESMVSMSRMGGSQNGLAGPKRACSSLAIASASSPSLRA